MPSLISEIQEAIAEVALQEAIKECKSKSVKKSLSLRRKDKDTISIVSFYYWAYWYHYGRGPIVDKLAIYFPNKKNDPRTKGGTVYPRTLAQKKKLSKSQALKAKKEGTAIFDTFVEGTKGDPFFSRINKSKLQRVAKKIAREALQEDARKRARDIAQRRIRDFEITLF